jgi:sugar lactone lactonase YvrE
MRPKSQESHTDSDPFQQGYIPMTRSPVMKSLHSFVLPFLQGLALLALPIGVTQARADILYVSRDNATITKIDTTTRIETTFSNLGSLADPYGLAFDHSGNLFAADFHFDSVKRITPDGVSSVFATGGLSDPLGLAIDSSGNIFVSNFAGTTIEKFTPGAVGSVFANIGNLHGRGLAFDGSGNLYLANPDSNNILRFTPGGVSSVFASGIHASGLAFDGSGNLYAADQATNTIERFTPGGVGSLFANTGLSEPEGIAFDSSGNLFVANVANATIERFTSGGVGSVFETGTPGVPFYLAVQSTAVPEPSSLILCGIGGFTGLVYAWRRRKLASPA